MVLSKRCVYGIQAAIFVAACPVGAFIPIGLIAQELDISFHFLTKVLQRLTTEGIMHSYRGPHGGVALARPADKITLYELIRVLDGNDLFTECVLGLPGCGSADPCPAHEQWGELRSRLLNVANDLHLAKLSERAESLRHRLAGKTTTMAEFLSLNGLA